MKAQVSLELLILITASLSVFAAMGGVFSGLLEVSNSYSNAVETSGLIEKIDELCEKSFFSVYTSEIESCCDYRICGNKIISGEKTVEHTFKCEVGLELKKGKNKVVARDSSVLNA